MRKIVLALSLVWLSTLSTAQIDTDFWFVAPEVADNGLGYDQPILLHLSAQDEAAVVRISLPANELFEPIERTIPANTSQTVDLSPYLNQIENDIPNTILNRGLFIESTHPIGVYYEVASFNCYCNPEIFVLKGENALGFDFWVPFQTFWANHPSYTPTPYSAFDIVATEDATTITITPSQTIVGHAANIPFTITLNAGQTFSARAASQAANLHPAGSRVVADKPIAITMKDDLLFSDVYGGCRDLLGDQIIPARIIGTDYIVVKGYLNNQDKVFVLATTANTSLTANGNTLGNLDAGQSMEIDLSSPVLYLQSSAPVYVLHVTGFGCEVGAAVLPPVDCAGSNRIAFNRSTDEDFGLAIVVPNGAQNQFNLNGMALAASLFSPVPGTNGNWYFARSTFPITRIPVGQASLLANTSSIFQLAIINGGPNSGSRYGFFSAFNELQFSLGGDQIWCEGTTLSLSPSPNIAGVDWLWQDGSEGNTFEVQEAGIHWVEAFKGSCYGADTILVSTATTPFFELPADTTLCETTTLELSVAVEGDYRWQDGSTASSFMVSSPGLYWLEVRDGSCSYRDSILVDYLALPFVNLGRDTVICENTSLSLDIRQGDASYAWSDGDTLGLRLIETPGLYTVTVSNACGISIDSKRIAEKSCIEECDLMAPNAFSPNDDGFNDGFALYPPACEVLEWDIQIYNRWGGLLFQSHNWEEPWNGKFSGSFVNNGVYVWRVTATLLNGFGEPQHVQKKGDLILMR